MRKNLYYKALGQQAHVSDAQMKLCVQKKSSPAQKSRTMAVVYMPVLILVGAMVPVLNAVGIL